MPNILHIIHGLTVGGAEVDLLHKSIALVQDYDYTITICCLMRRGELADRAEKAGIRVRGPLMHHRYDVLASSTLRQLLRLQPWSLVHTHIFAANLVGGTVLATLRSKQRPPLIASEHAMVERWGWFVPLYYRWLQLLAVAILVPSQSAADGYIKRGVREQHIRVMPNALDMARFERVDADRTFRRLRSQLGIPQEAYVIGTVCRLEKIKGIQLLIKAIQKLPVYLIIVGDGPERASLSALASELEISETIRFLGTRSDVPDLLNTFDLFVLPSYSESFGIVVAEALLTATPVVATRTGGIPDVTGEGQYAYLIPPGDEESLTSAISWMMEHPEEARKQALDGKRFVCHTFSLDVVVEKQHAMYQRCMCF